MLKIFDFFYFLVIVIENIQKYDTETVQNASAEVIM